MTIELLSGEEETACIRELFAEYTAFLVANSPEFAGYLKLQNYDDELEHPEQKYAPPDGRLYLARVDGRPAGCIALRKIDGQLCEMKRLYVRPAFRGQGVARTLVETILTDARQIGYRAMLLDTLPFLRTAIGLYRTLGFYDIPSYNDSPMESLIYLRLDLEP